MELEWYQGIVKAAADGELKAADSPKVYWDLVFENRVRELMATAHKKYKQYVLCSPPSPPQPPPQGIE